MEWKTIETAAKNERLILLCQSKDYAPYICTGEHGKYITWRGIKEQWRSVHGNLINDVFGYKPTHWLPLPEFPDAN